MSIFPVKSPFIGPQPPLYAMKSKEKMIMIAGFPVLTPVAGEGPEQPYRRQLKVTPPCSSQRIKPEPAMNPSTLAGCSNPKLIICRGPSVSQANIDSLPAISPLQKKCQQRKMCGVAPEDRESWWAKCSSSWRCT